MTVIKPVPFDAASQWNSPDMSIVTPDRPKAPVMSDRELQSVFGPWADWISTAARVKGAPADFVALSLIATASAIVGNTRWASPWSAWKEPPILWGMLVGSPSSGKSPAMDALLDPVKEIDRELADEYREARTEWQSQDEIAKLVLSQWKSEAKAALADGKDAPAKPEDADAGPPPIRDRVRITDATTEKVADLLSSGWRGLLLSRDELSGWIGGMDRYNGGGDRAFWLEAYGGRSFTVDRKGNPEPIIVDHLSIAILGGTQPDKLDTLLIRSDDDGLLARHLIAYPDQPPLSEPGETLDEGFAVAALQRLRGLQPAIDDLGNKRPFLLHFEAAAGAAFQEFRQQCRAWEAEYTGLMVGHIGKMPGLVVRVSTVLALLDYSAGGEAVSGISAAHVGRAAHYVGEHMRLHAYRAYGAASRPAELKAAARIARIIQSEGFTQISTREIQRLGLSGLQSSKEIMPAIAVLQDADWIAPIESSGPGRPRRVYAVNPRIGEAHE